jgi:hypothetical protein
MIPMTCHSERSEESPANAYLPFVAGEISRFARNDQPEALMVLEADISPHD